MKKMLTVGLVAALTAGMVSAQDEVVIVDQTVVVEEGSSVEVTAEVAVMSAYVWRGQVYNNDMVVQPQVTLAKDGFSLNVWGNYDLGENNTGTETDFSEIDISLAYSLPLDINEMAFDVGIISYDFPNNGDEESSKSVTELFASATVLSWQDYVIPSVTLFGSVNPSEGVYILFDVVAPYQVSDYLSVEAGVSAGWGSTSYNDKYWRPAGKSGVDEGFNDYNFYANAGYEIADNLTASVNLTYTLLEGGAVESRADDLYENGDKFWGGVNLSYDF